MSSWARLQFRGSGPTGRRSTLRQHLPTAALLIDAFGLSALTEFVTLLTRNGGLDR